MKNIKIEAIMQSPVSITRDIINLDSLIAVSVANEMGLQDTKYDPSIKLKLPLEYDNELELYKASCGFYAGRESTEKWYKRWDDKNEMYVDIKKKILTGRGRYKNYAMPIRIIHAKKIIFFCRAEKKEIKRLLDTHIHTLGKKSSMGYGIVRKWIVSEIESDNSFVFQNGNLARQIPFENSINLINKCKNIQLDTNNSKMCTYVFPYWDISKQAQCLVPKVKFNNEKELLKYMEGD